MRAAILGLEVKIKLAIFGLKIKVVTKEGSYTWLYSVTIAIDYKG